MRYLTILILLSVRLLAQGFGMPASCTPDGTSFSESFGDGGQQCWTTGPLTCTHRWIVGGGTSQSISATPGSPPLYTACANALKMVTVAATNNYIQTAGTFPALASGSTWDMFFTVDVTANAMAAFDLSTLISPSSDANGSTSPGIVYFKCSAGSCTTTQLEVVGSTTSTPVTITTNAWHTIKVHYQSGAAASYMTVDGGAQNTFTENAVAATYLNIGTVGAGNLDAMTYYIGNMYINAVGAPNCAYPQALIDYTGSTNATVVTPALLNAATHGGNGVWTCTASPCVGLTFSTAAANNLLTPVNVCGTYYQNSTFGMSNDVGQAVPHSVTYYTPVSPTAKVSWSAGMWWQTNIAATDTNFYTVAFIQGSGGTPDYTGPELTGTGSQLQLHMESASGNSAGTVNVSPNTWYWITWQFNAGGTHTMQVYSAAGSLLGTVTNTSTGSNPPSAYHIGRDGSETGNPAGKTWWYANIKMDYVNGTYPLLP